MQGFFSKDQLQTPSLSERRMLSCAACCLYKTAQTPKIKPYGNFRKEIMIIGEAPGESENRVGKPWQGKMGMVLQRKYRQLGIDLFEDCVSLNAVNCYPVDRNGNGRTPTDHEIACCRQKVISAIKQYQPRVIILHGGAAVTSVIGYKWKKGNLNVMTWRGWTIPDREFNAWICPTFHPSFVERQEEQNEAEVIWTRDLKQAFKMVEIPLPDYPPEEECVEISYDVERVLKELNQDDTILAFDIETTGIKPYNTDKHRIVSIAFCNSEDKAYAIPFPSTEPQLKLLKNLLENPRIGKIAANMKYEDNWLSVLHGIQVTPWLFDTMLAAHILDNRPNISGLKIQAFLRFGMPSYDDTVSPYLKAENANTPNSIEQLVRNEPMFRQLLLYNGYDALLTYRLAQLQMKELGMIE